jgi:uncharacterized protein YpuA (DUF1002 family)
MEVFQRMSRGRLGRGSPPDGQSAEDTGQGSTDESQQTNETNDGRNYDVAEQDQEQQATGTEEQGGAGDMSQQINEAIQPVISNLQEQITQTVRQQLDEAGSSVSANGASSTLGLDSLGSVGEAFQSSLDGVVDQLQPFFQWVLEMLQKLWNWLTSLFTGGEDEGSESESEEGAEAAA